jgi:autoinducer 2-degrading protein
MYVQLVQIQVKPDRIEDFLDAFRINFEGTSKEPGNLRFDVLQDPKDETCFSIFEVFKDEAALDDHRKTPHYKETVALLDDIMSKPRSKDIYHMKMSDLLEGRG